MVDWICQVYNLKHSKVFITLKKDFSFIRFYYYTNKSEIIT